MQQTVRERGQGYHDGCDYVRSILLLVPTCCARVKTIVVISVTHSLRQMRNYLIGKPGLVSEEC